MKYPYIGRLVSPVDMVALFISKNTATPLTNNFNDIEVGEWDPDWHELSYKNITHEYLSNTWGVVESKEHAEFIIELAELHGFELAQQSNRYGRFFSFDVERFCFLDTESIAKSCCKQITIPLPPKAKDEEKISYTIKKGIHPKKDCEDFELAGVDSIGCAATVSVSFNDNDEIVNVCCENLPTKAKVWPQVGDEVVYNGESCRVLLPADKSGHIVVDKNGDYCNPHIADIKKPKSKQQLKIEELQTKLCNNNAVDNYILACDIINGDIEGLSYV